MNFIYFLELSFFKVQRKLKYIDIQYFIFSTDNVGLIAIDYLVRAADRGVKVRLLVDDLMVDAEVKDILTLDSHKNISVRVYNPVVNLGKNIVQKIKKFAMFTQVSILIYNSQKESFSLLFLTSCQTPLNLDRSSLYIKKIHTGKYVF